MDPGTIERVNAKEKRQARPFPCMNSHAILRMPPWLQAGVSLAGLILAFTIRWMTDRGANGVEMATFLPIIVLCALVMRWQIAAVTALVSLVLARLFLMHHHGDYPIANAILFPCYVLTVGLSIALGQVLQRAITRLEQQKDQADRFNTELQHRVNNILQIVRVLASRANRTRDPKVFYEDLEGRLDAFARANRLLGLAPHRPGSMSTLIASAIAPFPAQFLLEGADCAIEADVGITLAMLVHELATNAVKYGALSVDEGRVRLNWQLGGNEVVIDWREEGGPAVLPPQRSGLGAGLLRSQGLIRRVDLDFDAAGVHCVIVAPCTRAQAAHRQD